ncbi:MAG TPA: pyridoxal-phosphate dependent enzyme [Acidimicrobiales bacterium]|nr:pyridoxal-phosphate dependent enzyme [Acidimicrobiales bacterium]
MTGTASTLVCAGCGAAPRARDPFPFRCRNSQFGDVDHVLARVLDTAEVGFPGPAEADSCPFVSYRGLLHSYHRAVAGGISDERFVELVRDLDAAVARVDGRGFVSTPFARSENLSRALGFVEPGGVWVKDETGNVAGSHKARHLLGVALHLEVAELLGLADPDWRPTLAVASCGNAALAAAVIAAAIGWRLRVFVPVDADDHIVRQIGALGSQVVFCERQPGGRGDPTYRRLLGVLERGALGFTCQGNLNGLAIEGGETLGYEIVSELLARGLTLDHLVVQVGGGALASSCAQALSEAHALGALPRLPRIHTVQTSGAHPLERAYARVRAELGGSSGAAEIDPVLAAAAKTRSRYMWPWEAEPKSIAEGILDDETYDWLAVVRGMLATGGQPLVVVEDSLAEAHSLGEEAGFPVSVTGSAGLAGLVDLLAAGAVRPDERVAVLFTGVER